MYRSGWFDRLLYWRGEGCAWDCGGARRMRMRRVKSVKNDFDWCMVCDG